MRTYIKKWKPVELALLAALALALVSGAASLGRQDALQEKMIRLHVIANSDSASDQAMKLRARDAVLSRAEDILRQAADRPDAQARLRTALPELEQGYPMPDTGIGFSEMYQYGYTDGTAMLPLTKERAMELFMQDIPVFLLYGDNTEAMAFDADEIRSFDGIFGVEASEWETVKDRFTPKDYEKAFLDNPGDSFAIYQLRDNDDTARLHYMNSEYLEKKGLSAQKENYAAVYAGSLDRRGDTQDKLNGLYETFNIRRPEDFRGHSLSVSDIVALKQNGVVSCHYVDSRGFKALPDFLKPENYLKNAEMAMEDDYGMIDGIINNGPKQSTVADLEAQVKAGFSISLTELAAASHREQKKPSVLEKLRERTPEQTKNKTAPKRSAEREL